MWLIWLLMWPIWSFRVADVVVADMVCGRHGCGRYGGPYGTDSAVMQIKTI